MYAFTYAHVMFLRMFVAITSTHERDPDILNPLKPSVITGLHFEVFSAIQA